MQSKPDSLKERAEAIAHSPWSYSARDITDLINELMQYNLEKDNLNETTTPHFEDRYFPWF